MRKPARRGRVGLDLDRPQVTLFRRSGGAGRSRGTGPLRGREQRARQEPMLAEHAASRVSHVRGARDGTSASTTAMSAPMATVSCSSGKQAHSKYSSTYNCTATT